MTPFEVTAVLLSTLPGPLIENRPPASSTSPEQRPRPLLQPRGVQPFDAPSAQHVCQVPEPTRARRGEQGWNAALTGKLRTALDARIWDTCAVPLAYAPSSHQRRSRGAETTPRRTASDSSSAISVAQIGIPRTCSGPIDRIEEPASSATHGYAVLLAEDASSSARPRAFVGARLDGASASVTGVRSGLVSIARPERKRGRDRSAASAS
jgi:hypothetical protein